MLPFVPQAAHELSSGNYKPGHVGVSFTLPHTWPPLPPQAVFNEEVWKPSSDTYKSAHVSLRIMNLYDFVNSKTLFRTMR